MRPASLCAMPSPRWPIPAMAIRSVTLCSKQEFAIAVAAQDRGRHDAEDRPAECSHHLLDPGADGGMDRGVAHDALLDLRRPGLELRLDQSDESRRRLR